MPVIVIGNTKGGTGKSTLAVNVAIELARENWRVLLIDADDQQTAWKFTYNRAIGKVDEKSYGATINDNRTVKILIQQEIKNYQFIVVDAGGRDTEALRAALLMADLMVIPVQPRTSDLWAIEVVAEIVREARKRNPKLQAKLLVNLADQVGKKKESAINYLRGEFVNTGLEVYDFTIGRRIVFDNAFQQGMGISEYTPKDQKAIDELNELIWAITGKEVAGVSKPETAGV